MALRRYIEVFKNPQLRTLLLLGLLVRTPIAGCSVLLTLHVVSALHRNYAQAGLVGAAATLAAAASSPWRGKLMDRMGLRRTLLPSLIVLPIVWCIAPFVSYFVLLGLVVIGGALATPVYSIVRQGLVHNSTPQTRRTVISLDSVLVELAWIIGPAIAVIAATYFQTGPTLLIFQMAGVIGSFLLFWINPVVSHSQTVQPKPRQRWASRKPVAMLGMVAGMMIIISGTDMSLIAGLRSWQQQGAIGWLLGIWCAGSAVGGLLFGLVQRAVHPAVLLISLGLATLPCALASNVVVLAILLFVAGLLCAPSIASSVDYISLHVPKTRMGEVMGWHGAVGTIGISIGSPGIGWVIDHSSWQMGYLVAGITGIILTAIFLPIIASSRKTVVCES